MGDEIKFTASAKNGLNTQRMSVKRPEVQQVKEALPKHDALTDCLMEKICNPKNLNLAYKRVKTNKGAAGIDGMTVDGMLEFIRGHKEELLKSLLNGSYRPKPVREDVYKSSRQMVLLISCC